MAKILLDYVFPISVVEPTPAASTGFLKQACVIVKPKTGQEANVGQIFECTTVGQITARTDNTDAAYLLNAGMSRVYLLLSTDLNVAASVAAGIGNFWTLLISSDFTNADYTLAYAALTKAPLTFTAKESGAPGNAITVALTAGATAGAEVVSVVGKAITIQIETTVSTAAQIKTKVDANVAAAALVLTTIGAGLDATTLAASASAPLAGGAGFTAGVFDGVIGFSTSDAAVAQSFGSQANQVGFFRDDINGAKNMLYAFGKLLSNLSNWTNQQYISMPLNDGIETLGEANALFDTRVSFVLNDTEFGNRLALFAAGGKAIAAPYIAKNLRVDLQSRSLSWIAANQPQYTLVKAALLEARLQEDVIEQRYIQTQWISAGVIEVKLLQDNFVANGYIDIAEPKALWRIFGEMRSTL